MISLLFSRLVSHKKGVSPLIATVLLMAFAIALGAIVMTWGKNYVKETGSTGSSPDSNACPNDVTGTLVSSPDKKTICIKPDTKTIQFIYRNGGNQPLLRLDMTLIDEHNNIANVAFEQPIGKSEVKNVISSPYQGTDFSDMIKQVIITPVILAKGEEVFCVDALPPQTDIGIC